MTLERACDIAGMLHLRPDASPSAWAAAITEDVLFHRKPHLEYMTEQQLNDHVTNILLARDILMAHGVKGFQKRPINLPSV